MIQIGERVDEIPKQMIILLDQIQRVGQYQGRDKHKKEYIQREQKLVDLAILARGLLGETTTRRRFTRVRCKTTTPCSIHNAGSHAHCRILAQDLVLSLEILVYLEKPVDDQNRAADHHRERYIRVQEQVDPDPEIA